MYETENDLQERLSVELHSSISKLQEDVKPSMVVLPTHLVPAIRKLENFVLRLGETTSNPNIGWYEGLVVLQSRIAAHFYVF